LGLHIGEIPLVDGFPPLSTDLHHIHVQMTVLHIQFRAEWIQYRGTYCAKDAKRNSPHSPSGVDTICMEDVCFLWRVGSLMIRFWKWWIWFSMNSHFRYIFEFKTTNAYQYISWWEIHFQ